MLNPISTRAHSRPSRLSVSPSRGLDAAEPSSPEIGPPPENKPMGSPPPFPSAQPLQENPQPTAADALEPAQSDHAKSTPPPNLGNATAAPPKAYESTAPEPAGGTTREAYPPPSLSASPALEGTEPEELTSPLPPLPVEACPEAAATEASPSPSPQIAAASAGDTPPPSTPSNPPASPPAPLPDVPPADSAATVPKDAARLPAALESMDANRPTTPTPPKPPLKSGPEELAQQHPRPPCPTMLPPSPRRPPADIAHVLPEAETDAIAMTSEEAGASSACKGDAEGSSEASVPFSSPTEAEPGSPEMAPPGFEKFKSSWPPLPSPNLSVKTTYSLPNAATREEAANSLPELDAMDAKINPAPGLPPPSSLSLQQPLLRPPSPIKHSEPCSLDTPPPGFENFNLSRLPPPNETKYTSSDLIATKSETVKPVEALLPVPLSDAIYVETDSARNLLPPLESKVEGLLKQPFLRSTTPVAQSEPCSPEMAPPGFENFRSLWQPLSSPMSGTAHIMPDAAATEPLAMMLEEAVGPRPALEAMDVDMHAIHPLLIPLESGMEESLQVPQPRPPSLTLQDVPCLPDMAPPGFENSKSPQLLLPSPPLAQTSYTFNDPTTTGAEHVSEEATQMVPSGHENLKLLPLPPLLPQVQMPDVLADVAVTESVIGALDQVHHPAPVLGTIEEGTSPILSLPLDISSEGSLPQLEPQVKSVTTHAVDTQPDAPATNYMDFKSDETTLPPPALQAMDNNMDSATTALLLSGNGAEGSSPQLQHQPSSPSMQAVLCSLDDLELLPPPPPPFLNKEMGQMVCGSCRELIAYPRGAVHVQCAGCQTINLVLEAHEVGNVRCGRCGTLLMYPFGAPAVKCSLCLFITNIGERNVRPRISVEQVALPHPPELVNQG
uniref:Uncharacterized protein n=1 Tax=Avena sativa TaxID=4498 RepID=A0ACD5VMH7_AVESA